MAIDMVTLKELIETYNPKRIVLTKENFLGVMNFFSPSSLRFEADFRPYILSNGVRIDLNEYTPPKGLLDLTGNSPVFKETEE